MLFLFLKCLTSHNLTDLKCLRVCGGKKGIHKKLSVYKNERISQIWRGSLKVGLTIFYLLLIMLVLSDLLRIQMFCLATRFSYLTLKINSKGIHWTVEYQVSINVMLWFNYFQQRFDPSWPKEAGAVLSPRTDNAWPTPEIKQIHLYNHRINMFV